MKLLATLMLISSTALAAPGTPPPPTPTPPPPTSAPRPPGPPPTTSTTVSTITVDSIKPTLTKRNVFVIRGTHAATAKTGWKVETGYKINQETKAVEITLTAKTAGPTEAKPSPLQATVDITELANVVGKYDIYVVDGAAKELGRTTYEKK